MLSYRLMAGLPLARSRAVVGGTGRPRLPGRRPHWPCIHEVTSVVLGYSPRWRVALLGTGGPIPEDRFRQKTPFDTVTRTTHQ